MALKESFGDFKGTRNDEIQPNGTPGLPSPSAWPNARHRDVSLLKQRYLFFFVRTRLYCGKRAGVVRAGCVERCRQRRLDERHGADHDQLEQVL